MYHWLKTYGLTTMVIVILLAVCRDVLSIKQKAVKDLDKVTSAVDTVLNSKMLPVGHSDWLDYSKAKIDINVTRVQLYTSSVLVIATLLLVGVTFFYARETKRIADEAHRGRVEQAKPFFVPRHRDNTILTPGYRDYGDRADFIFHNVGNDAFSGKCSVLLWEENKRVERCEEFIRLQANDTIALRTIMKASLWNSARPIPKSGEEIFKNLEEAKAEFTLSYYDALGTHYVQRIPFDVAKEEFDFGRHCYPTVSSK